MGVLSGRRTRGSSIIRNRGGLLLNESDEAGDVILCGWGRVDIDLWLTSESLATTQGDVE